MTQTSELSPQTVLFLCTGNYYRSRFAEILFNALAHERQMTWRATSRGLAIERGVNNIGPLSAAVAERLHELGISSQEYLRMPLQVSAGDLEEAQLIVALKEAEHRPLLLARHPEWEDRVEYWHIHDTDLSPPAEALQEIEQLVRGIVSRLQGQ